jgi:predicted RNA-binding Zn-ribbon protein involved in translation (DUF1610 family)
MKSQAANHIIHIDECPKLPCPKCGSRTAFQIIRTMSTRNECFVIVMYTCFSCHMILDMAEPPLSR